ncbi:Pyrazinamidase/nicotinamidase [Reticulomyxa filosa]|uniref:nicotinamidase n=1 Tax=Reticulomyxa filosa TaxID=46433 RepID=X6NN18_RETFI|nr:Pyrazinamidase/nicotinamidase [Reticulomyxa filosa]|eukprot:ETO27104.1 Pyrazinamidase/nicotinamidase [Reticulomyxa filosa]
MAQAPYTELPKVFVFVFIMRCISLFYCSKDNMNPSSTWCVAAWIGIQPVIAVFYLTTPKGTPMQSCLSCANWKAVKCKFTYRKFFIEKKLHFFFFFFFEPINTPPKKKKKKVMWPDHCVQGSDGAKIHKELVTKKTDKIILKGTDTKVDSYSAFMDNDKKTKTALEGILKEASIHEIYCVGLAYDYCVGSTAIDGATLKFKSFVLKDCSASVAPESEKAMEEAFKKHGVQIINLSDLAKLK